MANRKIETRPIDAELIRQRMKEKKISIRTLAKYVGRDEKTIRGYLKKGVMPIFVRLDTFDLLDIHPIEDNMALLEDYIKDGFDKLICKIEEIIGGSLNSALIEIRKELKEETDLTESQQELVMNIIGSIL